MLDELKNFLIKAKKATYAAGGENKANILIDGRKEYTFKEGTFKYIDRYKGHKKFKGQEAVFKNNKIIWQMGYEGKILSNKILTDDIYVFLRKALKKVSPDNPFRGPKKFSDGNYQYTNKVKGGLNKFSGREQILYQDELVYELNYKGGFTINITLNKLKQDLEKLKNPQRAKISLRFFKTGKGEYGEGDLFLGITMPKQRQVAQKYIDLEFDDIQELLNSKIHEYRMVGLLILTYKYKKNAGDIPECRLQRKKIFEFYLSNTKNINNWDLVDVTAPNIVGDYLLKKDRKVLYKLAKSKNLWEKRIAIISTFAFIRDNQFEDTWQIAKILFADGHDLIHKAVGWMLRETGKEDKKLLIKFLDTHSQIMPRTALRYAIERLPEKTRKYYLEKR